MTKSSNTGSGVTIYHNPELQHVDATRSAIAEELGVDADVVMYRKSPPDETTLREIIAKLEDPPTELVRRDALFEKLGLTDADVATVDQVVDVIVANKMIMQRPLMVTADMAIIGRPKDRVRRAALAALIDVPSGGFEDQHELQQPVVFGGDAAVDGLAMP